MARGRWGTSSIAPAITPAQIGRNQMTRSMFAIAAAALMTLGTFASTVAAVQSGSSPSSQIA